MLRNIRSHRDTANLGFALTPDHDVIDNTHSRVVSCEIYLLTTITFLCPLNLRNPMLHPVIHTSSRSRYDA